ncbi:hypothetical protein BDY24DRAFT_260978 [Mrakia frigida]|uniref:uncharacterized protein n=1 Tax=Mrakia frigida TaxID=29902 RepID=UPI003FCC06EF
MRTSVPFFLLASTRVNANVRWTLKTVSSLRCNLTPCRTRSALGHVSGSISFSRKKKSEDAATRCPFSSLRVRSFVIYLCSLSFIRFALIAIYDNFFLFSGLGLE